jgi:three-Cys-motif partner protein
VHAAEGFVSGMTGSYALQLSREFSGLAIQTASLVCGDLNDYPTLNGRHDTRVAESAQRFGGPWSLIKTKIVTDYLQAYTIALKKRHFRLSYIDAFAGSGSFTFGRSPATLFDQAAASIHHSGSARNALAIKPLFDEFVFIEEKAGNIEALQKLIGKREDAQIVRGDANQELMGLCDPKRWIPHRRRGVIFLDRFGLSVDWSTLEAIAKTKALDLWYLFSLSGLYRNAPINIEDLGPDKRAAVTRTLGQEDWTELFYETTPTLQGSLFDPPKTEVVRTLSVDGMEQLVHRRLKTIFPYVASPRTLYGPTNAPLYSLFFAVSNPSKQAMTVAKNIAEHLLKTVAGNSSQVRSLIMRPARFLFRPPHCLKKKAVPASRHATWISCTHRGSIGRARGPLSPPTIAQSICLRLAFFTLLRSGSNDTKRMAAFTRRNSSRRQ